MTQKLIELHRNNEEVLNQLLTARSNHADIEPREKSTEVEIGGLQVTFLFSATFSSGAFDSFFLF
jgi:hypothetical protein